MFVSFCEIDVVHRDREAGMMDRKMVGAMAHCETVSGVQDSKKSMVGEIGEEEED